MIDFLAGLSYIKSGLRLVIKPGIRLYVLVPLMINTLLFSLIIVYGAGLLNDLIDLISSRWAWLEWALLLLWPLFLMICLTIVFFCFSLMANLLCSPFNGFLAEAVQIALSGQKAAEGSGPGRSISSEMLRAMKSEIVKLRYFLIRAVPLLLLFLIPMIQIAAPLLWFIFASWMLCLEYLDYPMGNNGIPFAEARQILRKHRSLAVGFGTGILLCTMIPVVNFIAIPVAVAGATQLWTERLRS